MDHSEDARKLENHLLSILNSSSSSSHSLCDIQLLELGLDSFFGEKLDLCRSVPQPLFRSEIEDSITRIAALFVQVIDKIIARSLTDSVEKVEMLLIKAKVHEKISQACENFQENTFSEAFQISLDHIMHLQQLMELAHRAKLRSGMQYAIYLWDKGKTGLAVETADFAMMNVPKTDVTSEALEELKDKIRDWNRSLNQEEEED